jgi:glycosyltransferase involved in cell wall biosynthesis
MTMFLSGSSNKDSPRLRLHVAVYAIARNESQFAARFMQAVSGADEVLIADTGSTDATADAFRACGARVVSICVSPWRFDDARNAALALVSDKADVCVSLDCDEVIATDWRAKLDRAWTAGTTRLHYTSIYSWTTDNKPGIVYWADRIHARHGYRWRYPVHECIEWQGEGAEQVATCPELSVHHYPDPAKSRAHYLPMLERAVLEAPESPRMSFYLGRERFFAGDYAGAVRELNRYLTLPAAIWAAQRADACRFIAASREARGAMHSALQWRWKAVSECPAQCEAWVDLAYALYVRGDYAGGYYASRRALEIEGLAESHASPPEARGPLPHDLLANCAWRMGLADEAKHHATIAASLAPHDLRLQGNVAFFEGAAGLHSTEVDGERAP